MGVITGTSPAKIKGPSDYVILKGSFSPANTDPPTAAKGRGYSVARADVGEFTVTFDQVGVDLVHAGCGLMMAVPDGHYAALGAYDPDAKTLTIWLMDAADAADDLAADADTEIHFEVTFNQSETLS